MNVALEASVFFSFFRVLFTRLHLPSRLLGAISYAIYHRRTCRRGRGYKCCGERRLDRWTSLL